MLMIFGLDTGIERFGNTGVDVGDTVIVCVKVVVMT